MKRIAIAAMSTGLAGCTFGAISALPIQTAHGDVFKYEGRANFPHQIAEADKMVADHCTQLNGGRPVVVNIQKRHIGDVALDSYGASTLRNYNQTIWFRCVAPKS